MNFITFKVYRLIITIVYELYNFMTYFGGRVFGWVEFPSLNFAEAIDLETLEPIERVIIRAILQRDGSQYLKINKT